MDSLLLLLLLYNDNTSKRSIADHTVLMNFFPNVVFVSEIEEQNGCVGF